MPALGAAPPGGSIAVVMVNFRTPDLALRALEAVAGERTACPGLRAIMVDGGSGDGSAATLAAGLADPRYEGWAELLALDINGGFGWANNQAIQRLLQGPAPPAFIHVLNPDTVIEPGAIARLARTLDDDPRCGAVGSLLLEEDGTPSGSAFSFPSIRSELIRGARIGALARLLRVPATALPPGAPAQQVDWATGASVMFRSAALREAGLFDTGFFLYFEEEELMWRLRRRGWTIRHEPASRVRHVGGAATGVNRSLWVDERPPLPDYWYASRRRMLTLMMGRTRATACSLLWLAGHAAMLLRGARGRHTLTRDEGKRLWRNGIRPGKQDATSFATAWDAPPGIPPRWMDEPD